MDFGFYGSAENESASILSYLRDSSDKHHQKVAALFDKVGIFNGPNRKKGFKGVTFLVPSAEGLKEIESLVVKDLCKAQKLLRGHILNEDLDSPEKFNLKDIPDDNRMKLKVKSVKGSEVELDGASAKQDKKFVPICSGSEHSPKMSVWVLDGVLKIGTEPSSITPVFGKKNGGSAEVKQKSSNSFRLRLAIYEKLCERYLTWLHGDDRKYKSDPFMVAYASLIEFVQAEHDDYRTQPADPLVVMHMLKTWSVVCNMLVLLEPNREKLDNPALCDKILVEWWELRKGKLVHSPKKVVVDFLNSYCPGTAMICNASTMVDLDSMKSKISTVFMQNFSDGSEQELEKQITTFEKYNTIGVSSNEIKNVEPVKEHNYLYNKVSKGSKFNSLHCRKAWFDQILFECYTTLMRLLKELDDATEKSEKMRVLQEIRLFLEGQELKNRSPYTSCLILNKNIWKSCGIMNLPLYVDIVLSKLKNGLFLYTPVTYPVLQARKSTESKNPIDKKLDNIDLTVANKLMKLPEAEYNYSKKAKYEMDYMRQHQQGQQNMQEVF